MKKLLILCMAATLAACATGNGAEAMNLVAGKVAQTGGKRLIIQVPDAGNPISNGMQLAMITTGTAGNSVLGVMDALSVPNASIGITGSSQSVNVATLKRALRDFSGSSSAQVYIDASADDLAELQKLGAAKGVKVHGVR